MDDYDNHDVFPFDSVSEARDFFTKCAKSHLKKLLKEVSQHKPKIVEEFAKLKFKDYCARLIYILDMFAAGTMEETIDGEFDMDWALLFAQPSSAAQARRSLTDLVRVGLIDEVDLDEDEDLPFGKGTDYHKKVNPPEDGGETNPRTRFDFD